MLNRNKSTPQKNLYQQVMSRFRLVSIAVAIVAAATALLFWLGGGLTIENTVATDAIAAFVSRIELELQEDFEEIRSTAQSSFASNYNVLASEAALVGSNQRPFLEAQTNLLRVFDGLIDRNPDRYLAVRYITRDGRAWGEAINSNGQVFLSTSERAISSDEQSAAYEAINSGTPYVITNIKYDQENQPFITFYMPIQNTEESFLRGVLQFDVTLNSILASIYDLNRGSLYSRENRRIIVVDANGVVIGSTIPRENDAEIGATVLAMEAGDTDLNLGTQVLRWVEFSPYNGAGMPWHIILEDDLLIYLRNTLGPALIAVAFVLAGVTTFYFVVERLMRSTLSRLQTARGMAEQFVPDVPQEATVDEVDLMVKSLEAASTQINQLNNQVRSETRRRQRDIEVASRIGREIATFSNIDDLLKKAIELIIQEFGFYHAQVFLLDDAKQYAVLVSSHGEAGTKMMDAGHKIRVGTTTVIGQVTGQNRPVIINDTQEGGPHGFNPLLPDTRAEMGMPLAINNQVIGALDVQSRTPGVFLEDDLAAYTLLADQIAIAVNNARLLNETSQRVEQINRLNRQLTRDAWQNTDAADQVKGAVSYDLINLKQVETVSSDYQVPILIRGEVVGNIGARLDEVKLSEGDKMIMRAVSDRVALAIENARLFQETQNTLNETSTLYNLSRYLNEASTLEDVLQAMIVSTMQEAGGGQIWIFDDYITAPEVMRIRADLAMSDRAEGSENLAGFRLRVNDHDFVKSLPSNRVTLINDTHMDNRVDPIIGNLFDRMGARAVVIIPLNVRGEWLGVIMVEFEEPREFSKREGRIYTALIDQVGIAIDNRLLFEQTERALSRNENLYAASRIINTAHSFGDLVHAAAATSSNTQLNFNLALLEGDLDESGWPSVCRVVAESHGGQVIEVNSLHPVRLTPESPMRQRQPEIHTGARIESARISLPWLTSTQELPFIAIFPLFSANQPIALFYITSTEPYRLSQEDNETYRALTGQMSTQIENRRLLERTERSLDETRRLYRAGRAIASAQDAEGIFRVAIESISTPLREVSQNTGVAYEVSVLAARPQAHIDAPILECVDAWAATGSPRGFIKGEQLDNTDGIITRVLTMLEGSAYLPDLRSMKVEEGHYAVELMISHGANSAIVIPIRTRELWFGLFVCSSDTPRAFTDTFERYLEAISGQASLALENLKLFDDAQVEARRAQQEARRALALAEAARLANSLTAGGEEGTYSLDDIINQIVPATGFDRWILTLLNPAGTQLETIVYNLERHAGDEGDETRVYSLDNKINYIPRAVTERSSFVVNNLGDDANVVNMPEPQRTNFVNKLGKFVVSPVAFGDRIMGSLVAGRSRDLDDLDEGDMRLVNTLAAQIAVAIENRRLFEQAQREQKTLSSVLSTLPAGVLVLDPFTLKPVIWNDQAINYLGEYILAGLPFNAANYNLHRTGTQIYYPDDELPVHIAQSQNRAAATDDIAVIYEQGQLDLLVNAAPILNENGEATAIVTTFSDISNLRSLENTLQENLRETIAVYEAQRQLSQADDLENVLDVLDVQLAMMQPEDSYVLLTDQRTGELTVARSMTHTLQDPGIVTDALLMDRLISIPDTNRHNFTPEIKEWLLANNFRTMMTVPMRSRTRDLPIGWLLISSSIPNAFTAEQERILTQLGDVATTAIDNRYLIRSTREALEETDKLYRATTTLSRVRDADGLANGITSSLTSLQPDVYTVFVAANEFNSTLVEKGEEASLLRAVFTRYSIPAEGLFIEDIRTLNIESGAERDLMAAAPNLASVAVVPMRYKNSNTGRVIIGYRTPHEFDEGDRRFLSALSDSTAVVLDNITLVEEIQSTLEETTVLYQAVRGLTEATDSEGVLATIVDYLAGPHVDQVMIMLLKTRTWDSISVAVDVSAVWNARGEDLTGMTLTPDQFPAWKYLSAGTVVSVDDAETDPRLTDVERSGFDSLDVRSAAVVPLRVPNRTIGAIWISSSQPHQHSERELRVFQSFGEQASLSFEAAYLLQQTERRARQLETSAQVSNSAGQILDLEILLPQLVDLIRNAFGYDHTQIFLMDEEDKFAMLRASTGEAGQQLLGINHKLEKGSRSVIGQVTAQGKAVIALDTADAEVIHKPNPYLPLTRSEMALPLIIKGKVIGALDVQSNHPNAFSADDVSALTTLAAQISIAIENANLYKEAQSQADRMSLLFEITTAAAFAESLNEALETVASHLYSSQQALDVAIYLKRTLYKDDEKVDVLEAVASAGTDTPLKDFPQIEFDHENNLLAALAAEMQSLVIDDISTEPRYVPLSPEARSAMVVPMLSGSDLLGIIVMEDPRTYSFSYEELQLLLTLAGSLSAIVQNTQLLERLQAANDELRELDRIKSDFLANMSHELRTPLNSIIGFSRVMLKGIDGPLTEMQEQDLTTIYNSGNHLLALINDILDQAKIAAGKMDIKPNYFESKAVIDVVKSMAIGYMKDKPLQLYVEAAPNLPKFYADEIRLRQVLINLVSNAIKFTQEGSVTIRVYQYHHPIKNRTYIRTDVIDTGIGIAEKDIPLLFEAFRQVDSSLTRTQGGTGLGLPIAKSLIEMMSGEMYVESTVNVGSTFSVIVPTEPVKEETEDEDNGEAVTPVEAPTQRPPNMALETRAVPRFEGNGGRPQMPLKRQILLIEDSPDMVDQFRRILQRDGFEVLAASITLEAEAMASGLRPTLIVMDVNFAKGAGWDLLKRLKDRDDTFDIPIIVVTLNPDTQRAYQLGAHSVITRPFMPEDLLKVVLQAEKESNTERILIIDDQSESLSLLSKLLDEHGNYRVYTATNGLEGISLVARRRPDLVILDLRMPEMDGFAVLNELRSNPETSNIPVMIVTGDINLNEAEWDLLKNVRVLQKTDISSEEYDNFITRVQNHLNGKEG